MSSLQGQLLVAIPQLADPNFFRSVVLVLQHDEDGASGLILNRPSNVLLREAFPDLSGSDQRNVYLGGPVQGPLMVLHDQSQHSEQTILPGVFLSMQRECLDSLISDPDPEQEETEEQIQALQETGDPSTRARFFSGYAGWASRQLDDEIAVGGWFITPATPSIVFSDPEAAWEEACRAVGQDVIALTQGLKDFPTDSSNN